MSTMPPVWTRVGEMRRALEGLRGQGDRIVLVPTMGDLHEGHLSLVREGLRFGRVVVSIFVNPTQFAPGEDLASYPRNLERDRELLAIPGVVGVFAPEPTEMYPEGETTRVEVRELSEPLCGQHREGHFLGVTTICTKLFMATGCDVAVFGQKDAQQCLLLRRLVLDLCIDTELVFSPTVREAGGLAMSSRNRYLGPEHAQQALALSSALRAGLEALASGERRVGLIEECMRGQLRAAGLREDYIELRTIPDLEHPEHASGRVLLAGAVRVGRARLIDNLCVDLRDGALEVPLLDEHTPDAVLARLGKTS